MKLPLLLSVLMPLWCLSACATLRPAPAPSLFDDARFGPPTQRPTAAELFALSPAMRAAVDASLARAARERGVDQALLDALYSGGQLQLEYDAAQTRTAAEAFAARAGNCLSLVLMTAAFAQHLQLPVHYQRVYTPSTWTRSNGIAYASEHINIVLGQRLADPRVAYTQESLLTIDFLPPEHTQGQRTRLINQETVVAMYFNNRAAEALEAGDTRSAYWFARRALEGAPQHLNAYNTLGVIYLQAGAPHRAEPVFAHVLQQEPGNTLALGNQVSALQALGRTREAEALRTRLANLEPVPPFHYFDQGLAAYKAGDYAAARQWFHKELQRDAHSHEFHYALALTELALGNTALARRQLGQAADTSTTRERRGIYLAKLEALKGVERERVIR